MRQEAIPSTSTPTSPPQQRQVTVKRRDSARRHTLANGVDYNMVTQVYLYYHATVYSEIHLTEEC